MVDDFVYSKDKVLGKHLKMTALIVLKRTLKYSSLFFD